jgi:hypothetical protein
MVLAPLVPVFNKPLYSARGKVGNEVWGPGIPNEEGGVYPDLRSWMPLA